MKQLLFSVFLLFSLSSFAQLSNDESKWYDRYKNEYYKGVDLVNMIDQVKFIPVRKDAEGDTKTFKAVLLSLPKPALDQLNRDAGYLAAVKHEDYFQVWNLFYPKIDHQFWDRNCKLLLCLMCIDNTAKTR